MMKEEEAAEEVSSSNLVVIDNQKKRRKELKELIEYEQQLKDLLRDLEYKIYELEGIYLEETPMGNILKGWEIDGKLFSSRPRTIDEKERLFSNSSYRVYMEGKLSSVLGGSSGVSSHSMSTTLGGNEEKGRKNDQSSNQPKKKVRRSTSMKKDGLYDEWENDY